MAEYIEREAFIKWVNETYCKPCEAAGRDYNHCRCGACQYDDMIRDAESFDAADVAPVRRGRWIQKEKCYPEIEKQMDFRFECSECGFSDIHNATLYVPYCWHCGAKMDKEEQT